MRFTDRYQQLLFPMFPFIMTVNFDLNLEFVLGFLGETVHMGGWGEVQKLIWGLLIVTSNFCFLSMAQIRL